MVFGDLSMLVPTTCQILLANRRAGLRVGDDGQLKSGRSAVRSRLWPPPSLHKSRAFGRPERAIRSAPNPAVIRRTPGGQRA